MAAPQREWTLAELAEELELSARTIRFYISRGLVPGPLRGGRAAIYGAEHRAALSRIKELQGRGYALTEIARELSGEAVEAPTRVPVPWWQYGIAEDVQVWVQADASPWRLKQIKEALAEFAARLEKQEERGERDE